jgi:metallophosphoesterase (TIGR00282 family)
MHDKINILFLGDIIGRPGRHVLDKHLPALIKKLSPTVIIANGENAAGGAGLTMKIARELFVRVDVLTSGNHIWDKREVLEILDKESHLLRPANYPPVNPGRGVCVFETDSGAKVGVMSLQGRVFMEPIDCPFRTADKELEALKAETPVVIIDFHAEATSEKQALGWYLDGRVSAVIGTHTHVPTADEKILPRGTAYISDVGMVGGYHAVIGINKEAGIARFLTARSQRFEPAKEGSILSGVFITVDAQTGRALSIQREMIIDESSEL